jgi:hypothetical protein
VRIDLDTLVFHANRIRRSIISHKPASSRKNRSRCQPLQRFQVLLSGFAHDAHNSSSNLRFDPCHGAAWGWLCRIDVALGPPGSISTFCFLLLLELSSLAPSCAACPNTADSPASTTTATLPARRN